MKFKRLKNITNSIEKKQAPYYIRKYLEELCAVHLAEGKLNDKLFESQAELASTIAAKYPDMKSLNQSSVSRTFKTLLLHDLDDECGNYYRIAKVKEGYFLRLRCQANEMVPLYTAPNIFTKDSAFMLTDSTVVFQVVQNKTRVDAFIALIETNVSEDLLWGISHQGSYLYLMFNKGYTGWASYYKAFFNYFDSRKIYLGNDTVERQIEKAKSEEKKNRFLQQADAVVSQTNKLPPTPQQHEKQYFSLLHFLRSSYI